MIAASDDGHGIAVDFEDIALLSGVGQGSMLIKLQGNAELIAATTATGLRTGSLTVMTDKGKKYELFAESLESSRGARGKAVVKRSGFKSVQHETPEVPSFEEGDED